MDAGIAINVEQYLKTIALGGRVFAYLGLDKQHIVCQTGGATDSFDLASVSEGEFALGKLGYLEGLLPSDDKPIVIENTQFMRERFVDIHIFKNNDIQWVVFIDNTEPGKLRQTLQQQRLNADILKEARKS